MEFSRRKFLAAAGATAAFMATNPTGAFASWVEGNKALSTYPDPNVKVLDDRFKKYKLYSASVERLATGFRWAEGPAWFGDGRYLLFSDVASDAIMKWDEISGQTTVFRSPSNYSNGLTRDRQGRLITCESRTRRVTRTEIDGSITVIADNFNGKKLNSPNDIVVKSDGSIWFTDPPFSHNSFYEGGDKAPLELPQNVYRVDGTTLEITVVADDIKGPNGLAFSPDESKLYVIEARSIPNRKFLVYDVTADGKSLANKRIFIDTGAGATPDGFRVDVDGNLWCGWGGSPELNGVKIFAPDGAPIGHISTPERVANLTFGGAQRNHLLMCSCQSLYGLYTEAQGATFS